jgi:spore germination protein GerM
MTERIRVKGDSGVLVWVVLVAALAVVLAVAGYFFFREQPRDVLPQAAPVFQGTTGVNVAKASFRLYFPSDDGASLLEETRDVHESSDKAVQVREVVSEILRGPLKEGLVSSFPAGSRVKNVFIDSSGTAYVNFSRELQADFPGGAWTETLAIYSLTNTLVVNFPEIKQVQILVEGDVPETLAGHIDISRPFTPRLALNKEQG